jgi:hypothetical protein
MKNYNDLVKMSMEVAETLTDLEPGIQEYTRYQHRTGAQRATLILLQQFEEHIDPDVLENIVLRITQNAN